MITVAIDGIAIIPSWAVMTIESDSLDVDPKDGEPFTMPSLDLASEILAAFDRVQRLPNERRQNLARLGRSAMSAVQAKEISFYKNHDRESVVGITAVVWPSPGGIGNVSIRYCFS